LRLHTRGIGLIALVASVLAGAGIGPLSAQRQVTPPVVISSLSGGDLFRFYCTSCHGSDGTGNGPVAVTLKTPPPDLRRIAARNGGAFPSEELQGFVAGNERLVPAHGSREMPVWGPIFQSLEPHDRLTRIRIENVVRFLESIQKP
jgi:hypothetical protein